MNKQELAAKIADHLLNSDDVQTIIGPDHNVGPYGGISQRVLVVFKDGTSAGLQIYQDSRIDKLVDAEITKWRKAQERVEAVKDLPSQIQNAAPEDIQREVLTNGLQYIGAGDES